MEGDVWVQPNLTSSRAIPRLGGAASNGHGGEYKCSCDKTPRLKPSNHHKPTAPGSNQSLAIRSWLALSPQITVVLFTQHPSHASAFGSRVLVGSTIDFTYAFLF
uniref:Uncharacterized protein n=1 Tax=Populus alba TaxID=43335 RepID=A0A4U5MAX6_POPAL|nr:hypothetical protein D5086_0000313460 [Populus alba]